MGNKDYAEKFDQELHSSYINKLHWIAGSIDSSDFKSDMLDLEECEVKELFPEIKTKSDYKEFREEISIWLYDNQKFGFIAEIRHPQCENFRFDENKEPSSWSVRMGVCRVSFIYAEDIKTLYSKIEEKAEQIFNEYVQKEIA